MKHKKYLFLCLLSWIMLAFTARAEDANEEFQEYILDEIVVTATRGEMARQEIAANIEIISKAEMDRMPASNVAEVLQYISGVYIEFNGGLGSQAVASIQGSDFRHVVVYLDGVPLNQLANPMTDLSYIPIDAIERIEVYKGAASSAWGSSLGGVIHITTTLDSQKPIQGVIHSSYGDFSTLKSRGNIKGAIDHFDYFLSLTHDENDGFTDYTAYHQNAFYGKIGYKPNEFNRFGFVYSFDEGDSEEPYTTNPWDNLSRKRAFQLLSFETSPIENLRLSIQGWHHRFDHQVEDVYPDYRVTFSDYWERTFGISARVQWDISQTNTFIFGLDSDWGRYDWHGLYNSSHEAKTGNTALYTNDTVTFGDFSINAGLRYDDNRDFGNEISPSVGVVYLISGGNALIRGQVAKGFSAPPGTWLHVPIYGNPDLKPEIGMSYQLGGQLNLFSFLTFELNLFKADIQDLISFDLKELRYVNLDRVRRQGIEGSIHLDFDIGLNLSLSANYIDVKNDLTDEVIHDIPRTLYHVQASYSDQWMTHTILGKYIDHNSTFPETRDQVFIFDYLLKVKLPLPIHYGKFTLYGTVYNLTDVAYIYRGIWPHPGRWFEGGVSMMF